MKETRDQQQRTITASWPIDRAALVSLHGEKVAMTMLDYLADFFQDGVVQVQALERAVAERDGQAMVLAAHTLRGSCSMMAMTSLVDYCRAIEAAGDNGALDEAVAQAQALTEEYALIQSVLAPPSQP